MYHSLMPELSRVPVLLGAHSDKKQFLTQGYRVSYIFTSIDDALKFTLSYSQRLFVVAWACCVQVPFFNSCVFISPRAFLVLYLLSPGIIPSLSSGLS